MKKSEILQAVWVWNDTVTEFVKDRIKGYSLNVCAGKNPLCNVNIDLDPQDKKVIRGDMINLQFEDNTFDTVVSDPPGRLGIIKEMKPFFECVRVCKVGGNIIYNAYWIPTSKEVKLKEVWVRRDSEWGNTSIISIFEKIKKEEE